MYFILLICCYVDLIVYCGLISVLGLDDDGLLEGIESKLEVIGVEIFGVECRVMFVECDMIDWLIVLWMGD